MGQTSKQEVRKSRTENKRITAEKQTPIVSDKKLDRTLARTNAPDALGQVDRDKPDVKR